MHTRLYVLVEGEHRVVDSTGADLRYCCDSSSHKEKSPMRRTHSCSCFCGSFLQTSTHVRRQAGMLQAGKVPPSRAAPADLH